MHKHKSVACDGDCLLVAAKGRWQRSIAEDLAATGVIENPLRDLRGRAAASYRGRYERSLEDYIGRLKAAGVDLVCIPGPRGGRWAATWQLL